MQWDRIVYSDRNPQLLKFFPDFVPLLNLYSVLRIDTDIVGIYVRRHQYTLQQFSISGSNTHARFHLIGEDVELCQKDSRLKSIHATVYADNRMVITAILAMN